MSQRTVFVSYAHPDRDDVMVDVDLLRAGGVRVFVDVLSIEFGERWRDRLAEALAGCERVMVFWSAAARASEWVEREWRCALQLGKKIVPTLLDATPLPHELAEFQVLKRPRRAVPPAMSRPAPAATPGPGREPAPRARASARWAPLAAGLGLGAVALAVYLTWLAAPLESPPVPTGPPPGASAPGGPMPPPAPLEPSLVETLGLGWGLAAAGLVIVAGGGLLLLRRRRRPPGRSSGTVAAGAQAEAAAARPAPDVAPAAPAPEDASRRHEAEAFADLVFSV